MGHYFVDMFPNGRDLDFPRRWAEYKQACAREIDGIISKNKINLEDIKIGDWLKLYSPLEEKSRVSFDGSNPYEIKEYFGSSFGLFGFEMRGLKYGGRFTVYDKREKDQQVRISKIPPKSSFDFFPVWVSIKYFEPIIIHHDNI